MDLSKLDVDRIMALGKKMLISSYSPYSDFKVGAVAICEDGSMFPGCNVENTSYSLTICAEVTAICNMVSQGQQKLQTIFIFSPSDQFITPCGACRQTILEFSEKDTPIFLVNSTGKIREHKLSSLIPHAFNLNLAEEV